MTINEWLKWKKKKADKASVCLKGECAEYLNVLTKVMVGFKKTAVH